MASPSVPVSVIISTLNRSESLRRALIALRYQRYPNFEVVVVDGPAEVPAEAVAAEFGGVVRYLRCPEVNLSKSRNLGIKAAGGEIVAFIDDDAVPEPAWLGELVAGYNRPEVAGVGGIVYDFTGTRLQYRYSASDRVGRTFFSHATPPALGELTGADRFTYLQGTNMSYRRDRLAEVGGFDEEIEYNFDEVELCLQLLDRGYELEQLEGAAVHHKYLPSHVRNADRLFTDPYLSIKNRVYFALRYGRAQRPIDEVLKLLHAYAEEVRASAEATFSVGKFSRSELDYFLTRTELGFSRGLEAGLAGERRSAQIPPPEMEEFAPFARLQPEGERLRGAFLSQEYPPGDFGGVGRYTAELAQGFAAEGHEIHVFTRSVDGIGTIDFEAGCWVHRVPARDKRLPELEGSPAAGNLYLLAANLHEVDRCRESEPLDFVSAPLWLCEGLCCSLDPTLPTVTTLVTTMKTITGLHPSWRDDPHPQAMLRLEGETVIRATHLHAISEAILSQVREDYPATKAPSFVIPLGIADRLADVGAPAAAVEDSDRPVQVLFVGRLERRKGVDVLLEAAPGLLREFPNASFVLAGKDTLNTEQEGSYREAFQRAIENEPELAGRVRFTGAVSEDELWRLYRDCDIFCAPSRFESFGLVLVEAMMFGKPVVGCAAGGMAEIVQADETGLLAEPGDAESLATCLRRLLGDPELRTRLGAAARARYLEHYELGVVVARTVSAYRELAGPDELPGASADGRAAVRAGFAQVIAQVAQIDEAQADSAARRLLDPQTYPIDFQVEVEHAWRQPPDEFVRTLYEAILGRTASDADLTFWHGPFDLDWRLGVISAIGRSTEAQSLGIELGWLDRLERDGGPVQDARELAGALGPLWSAGDEAFLNGIYRELLRRVPEPEGRDTWLPLLGAGVPRTTVMLLIAGSPEARKRGVRPRDLLEALGDAGNLDTILRSSWHLPDHQFLATVYCALLGREPDETGGGGFAARLRDGLSRIDLVREIAGSEEARSQPGSDQWLDRLERDPPSAGPRARGRSAVRGRLSSGYSVARRAKRAAGSARRLPSQVNALRTTVDAVLQISHELQQREHDAAADREAIRRDLDVVGGGVDRVLNLVHARDDRERQSVARDRERAMNAVMAEVVDRLEHRFEALGGGLVRLEQTVDVLRRKQEAVSLDLREHMAPAGAEAGPPEPRVLDPAALERRIADIGAVRLNLGCGEKPLPDYVNVDFRALPDVDIVADVRQLPFGPGAVDEIASSHLVEHFRQHQLQHVILPYWREVLRPGGVLRIVCPNWSAMLERVQAGEMTLQDFKVVTFGLQDYEGDDHFAMYSPDLLTQVLEAAEFERVEVVAAERRNGISTEMELTAVKPAP